MLAGKKKKKKGEMKKKKKKKEILNPLDCEKKKKSLWLCTCHISFGLGFVLI